MRVTRESLIKIAKQTAQERASNDKDIVAVYVTGALAAEMEPMLGGTADIDMVFVHASEPVQGREIARLTPDFHIDIAHRAKAEFKSPREMRGDPWLGWEMFAPTLVYEREKFFDFVQAALRAGFEFEGPAMTLQRCRTLLSHGRQIWMDLTDVRDKAGPTEVAKYLKSLFHAGNTVAELSGPPVYERRFLLEFPARANATERPGMAAGMKGLLGLGRGFRPESMRDWLADWEEAFLAASSIPGVDPRIHAGRLNYYKKGVEGLLESETPEAALWPLVHTWTLAAKALPDERNRAWKGACETLGLVGERFSEHVEGLDQYLDEVEILLDELATANGLEAFNSG
jgi:hypothetical protein